MTDIYNESFKIFAKLHPIEAYELDKKLFCNYMRSIGYNLTDKQIKKLI